MAEIKNYKDFEDIVLKSTGLVLVDLWAPTCGPCVALTEIVEKLAKKYSGKLQVIKVNIVGKMILCRKLGVFGVPTVLIYKDGQEMKRLTPGTITNRTLEEAVEEYMEKDP